MKGLDTGKDKVKKICEVLRKETLEPARIEAEAIAETARLQAEEIIAEARAKADQLIKEARQEIDRQRAIFQASLVQACRQTMETLRDKILEKLFNPQLTHVLAKPLQDPDVIVQLVQAVIKAIETQGIDSDLSVYVSTCVPAEEVNRRLGKEIVNRLREKSVLLSQIGGGIEVKLVQENITLDLSDVAIRELVAGYVRKDFRDLIFSTAHG